MVKKKPSKPKKSAKKPPKRLGPPTVIVEQGGKYYKHSSTTERVEISKKDFDKITLTHGHVQKQSGEGGTHYVFRRELRDDEE